MAPKVDGKNTRDSSMISRFAQGFMGKQEIKEESDIEDFKQEIKVETAAPGTNAATVTSKASLSSAASNQYVPGNVQVARRLLERGVFVDETGTLHMRIFMDELTDSVRQAGLINSGAQITAVDVDLIMDWLDQLFTSLVNSPDGASGRYNDFAKPIKQLLRYAVFKDSAAQAMAMDKLNAIFATDTSVMTRMVRSVIAITNDDNPAKWTVRRMRAMYPKVEEHDIGLDDYEKAYYPQISEKPAPQAVLAQPPPQFESDSVRPHHFEALQKWIAEAFGESQHQQQTATAKTISDLLSRMKVQAPVLAPPKEQETDNPLIVELAARLHHMADQFGQFQKDLRAATAVAPAPAVPISLALPVSPVAMDVDISQHVDQGRDGTVSSGSTAGTPPIVKPSSKEIDRHIACLHKTPNTMLVLGIPEFLHRVADMALIYNLPEEVQMTLILHALPASVSRELKDRNAFSGERSLKNIIGHLLAVWVRLPEHTELSKQAYDDVWGTEHLSVYRERIEQHARNFAHRSYGAKERFVQGLNRGDLSIHFREAYPYHASDETTLNDVFRKVLEMLPNMGYFASGARSQRSAYYSAPREPRREREAEVSVRHPPAEPWKKPEPKSNLPSDPAISHVRATGGCLEYYHGRCTRPNCRFKHEISKTSKAHVSQISSEAAPLVASISGEETLLKQAGKAIEHETHIPQVHVASEAIDGDRTSCKLSTYLDYGSDRSFIVESAALTLIEEGFAARIPADPLRVTLADASTHEEPLEYLITAEMKW
jgi:hypothetical protein